MIKYAEVVDSTVVNIIMSTEAHIQTLPGNFVKAEGALNEEFLSIGCTYNKEKNAFAAQKPYPSWTLNEDTYRWEAPVPKPTTGISVWDEDSELWIDITPVEIELPQE